MIAHKYDMNPWSFNDMMMDLGNHREGSYYSKFSGDTKPCESLKVPPSVETSPHCIILSCSNEIFGNFYFLRMSFRVNIDWD